MHDQQRFSNPRLTHRRIGRLCLLALIAILAAGCTPTRQPASEDTQKSSQALLIEQANQTLTQAIQSPTPEKERLLIQAALKFHQAGNPRRAMELLASLDADTMAAEEYLDYVIHYSNMALDQDAYFLAQDILTNPALEPLWGAASLEQKTIIRQRRADIFMLLGNAVNSIEERIELEYLLAEDSEAAESNRNNLWQSVLTLSTPELQDINSSHSSETLKGWIELALLSKNNQGNLEKQLRQVQHWQQRWPLHSAAQHLPPDLRLLQRLVENQPRQIALLLPQTGGLEKAGNAIRDGFMAALHQARLNGAQTPEVRFYDTENSHILSLYQTAVTEGAQMVIGPLDKDRVAALNSLTSFPVPTLAVNYLDNTTLTPGTDLYQIGLAVEDESRQVARRAWLEGHRYAMVLTNDTSWGTRSADSFSAEWQNLGGEVLIQSQFSEQLSYSEKIGQLLNIDDSKERYKKLSQRLGKTMEFEPRRRQDLDVIYLVARPEEARQIKPTLAFHYASDLPVYATSHIYQSTGDQSGETDLNGIRFTTLPWTFDQQSPEKRQIDQLLSPAPSYEKLYALGVDVYYLHPRLPQLEISRQTRFYGVTGSVYMTADRQLHREQIWAMIRNGKVGPLPPTECQRPDISNCDI